MEIDKDIILLLILARLNTLNKVFIKDKGSNLSTFGFEYRFLENLMEKIKVAKFFDKHRST